MPSATAVLVFDSGLGASAFLRFHSKGLGTPMGFSVSRPPVPLEAKLNPLWPWVHAAVKTTARERHETLEQGTPSCCLSRSVLLVVDLGQEATYLCMPLVSWLASSDCLVASFPTLPPLAIRSKEATSMGGLSRKQAPSHRVACVLSLQPSKSLARPLLQSLFLLQQ